MLAGDASTRGASQEEGRLADAEVTPCLSRSAGQPWLPRHLRETLALLSAMFSQEQTTHARAWPPLSPAILILRDFLWRPKSLIPFSSSL